MEKRLMGVWMDGWAGGWVVGLKAILKIADMPENWIILSKLKCKNIKTCRTLHCFRLKFLCQKYLEKLAQEIGSIEF